MSEQLRVSLAFRGRIKRAVQCGVGWSAFCWPFASNKTDARLWVLGLWYCLVFSCAGNSLDDSLNRLVVYNASQTVVLWQRQQLTTTTDLLRFSVPNPETRAINRDLNPN